MDGDLEVLPVEGVEPPPPRPRRWATVPLADVVALMAMSALTALLVVLAVNQWRDTAERRRDDCRERAFEFRPDVHVFSQAELDAITAACGAQH